MRITKKRRKDKTEGRTNEQIDERRENNKINNNKRQAKQEKRKRQKIRNAKYLTNHNMAADEINGQPYNETKTMKKNGQELQNKIYKQISYR